MTTDDGNNNLGGSPTNTPVKMKDLTVPLSSFSGTASTYTNTYNGSNQFNFACKHDGTLFFVATNAQSLISSRRDKVKVAWREVPGKAQIASVPWGTV